MKGSTGVGRPQELGEPRAVQVVVFTRDYGPLPATSISLYCRSALIISPIVNARMTFGTDCLTRYYHNHYLHDGASKHTYYVQVPHYIQATQHTFIDRQTCEIFTSMMVNAWYVETALCGLAIGTLIVLVRTSARNCALIYNSSLSQNQFQAMLPLNWPSRLKLDVELVWDSLFLYWLLEDCEENKIVLELDHKEPSQELRLAKGLRERTLRFIGTGQPAWNHACDLCCWMSTDSDGGKYCLSCLLNQMLILAT